MHVSEPNEDYLERIYELLGEKGYARVSDIADKLKVKPASVTRMLQRLEIAGLLSREPYRGFTLTKKGHQIGKRIQTRHQILIKFLQKLGVPEKFINKDIEGLEHHLSDQTVKRLQVFLSQPK
jgi:Mn-dependent DtxR family transcriptional regulator